MKFNILIAEDEKEIREILASMVEMIFQKDYPFLDLQVSTAENGKIALSIAQEQHQDIILSDIVMPVMDGLKFISKVRLFDKSVPILVLSALSSSEDVDKIMQSGASNYTTKPLIGKLFTAQIKVFVDFYLRRQNKYNHSAINLYSKNIYKRKTEFLVEKEDDIVEFWEFLAEGILEKYRAEKVLRFIYDTELFMIKKGLSNSIILEECDDKYYLTISEIDKLDGEAILNISNKYTLDESHYKNNGFFLSTVIDKDEEDKKQIIAPFIKQEPHEIKNDKKEARLNDIRYSIHEKVSPEEFLSELDPSFEDKIENFLDDLSTMSIHIFNLEDTNLEDTKENIGEIIAYLDNFNETVDSLGLFNVINRSFNDLISFLTNLDEEILTNSEKRVLLSQMLQGLADDLGNWISTLFMDRNATDIHYLDASFSDNCFAIESTFTQTQQDGEEEDEDDLEFF